jgi:hypothetical protein
MNSQILPADLNQVLCAYYEYWHTIDLPEHEREVCYTWILPVYRRMFGGSFHQSKLQRLVDLAFLIPGYSARGGNRRYYRLADPQAVHDLLTETACG